jgi:hypothetical protein
MLTYLGSVTKKEEELQTHTNAGLNFSLKLCFLESRKGIATCTAKIGFDIK